MEPCCPSQNMIIEYAKILSDFQVLLFLLPERVYDWKWKNTEKKGGFDDVG